MLTLGRNISALRAERMLGDATAQATRTLERLSSGQRINRASDDAAGLSISSTLDANARIYGQAVRNGNDALSALSIAEGGIRSGSAILERLKELAIQASNGSFSRTQRLSLDAESEELTKEFNRLMASTRYNSLSLLSGEYRRIAMQLGVGTQGVLSVGFTEGLTRKIGTGIGALAVTGIGDIVTDLGSADFNGDGVADLLVADAFNSQVTLSLGNGQGGFGAAQVVYSGSVGSLVAADFNGDGRPDIAVGGGSSISILSGNGDGTFGTPTAYSMGGVVNSELVVGDFNGDGTLDIAGRGASNTIRTLISQGPGFVVGGAITLSATVIDLDVGDFNGDGITDIVGLTSSNIETAFGSSSGYFSSVVQTATGVTASRLVAGDFNFDGITDIAVTSTASQSVLVRSGLGAGQFGTATSYTLGSSLGEIQAADMDGDGYLDLVVGRTNGLYTLKGRGEGTFDAAQNVTRNGVTTSHLLLADINGDGVRDYLTSTSVLSEVGRLLSSTQDSTSLERVNLSTREGALAALAVLDLALNRIQSQLGSIGASQSRMSSAVSSLFALRENSLVASGRITDADVAEESAGLVRRQILQQTGAAVLAQANQAPALVLQLL